ncbi:hypothetical protein Cpir12675_002016 [Ceratocystis pirilliformis]|uniref:Uncharacterized protein n=1 Tax=Ceratocystis pirilliformis TaxID=259994 RepID=A0ABR3ZCD6_9PEZI
MSQAHPIQWSKVVQWAQIRADNSAVGPSISGPAEEQVIALLPAMLQELGDPANTISSEPDVTPWNWVGYFHATLDPPEETSKVFRHGKKAGELLKWHVSLRVDDVIFPNLTTGFIAGEPYYFSTKKKAKQYAYFCASLHCLKFSRQKITARLKQEIMDVLHRNPNLITAEVESTLTAACPAQKAPTRVFTALPTGPSVAKDTAPPQPPSTNNSHPIQNDKLLKHAGTPDSPKSSSLGTHQAHSPTNPNKRQELNPEDEEIAHTRERVREMCHTLSIEMPQVAYTIKSAPNSKPSISAKLQFKNGQNFLFPNDFVVFDKYDKKAAEQNLWDDLIPSLDKLMETHTMVS